MARRIRQRHLVWILQVILLVGTVLAVTFPLIWMVSSSFKSKVEVTATPPTLLPAAPTVGHYLDLFKLTHFEVYFGNSVLVAGGVTLVTITLATLGGYTLARHKQARWVRLISRSVLLSYVFPEILLVIPIFLVIKQLGLADTRVGLALTNVTFVLPFSMWLLKTYFEAIPRSYEEAAFVDGASRLQAFVRVAVPMALPGIISTAIFAFIEGWNEFLFALVLISTDASKTLPVGVSTLMGRTAIYSWGMLMAAAVLITIPALIFFAFVQRRLVAGHGEGGIKG